MHLYKGYEVIVVKFRAKSAWGWLDEIQGEFRTDKTDCHKDTSSFV